MLLFRWIVLLLLITAVVLFAGYAVTGKQHLRRLGWIVLKWTLVAAFAFFAVLIVQRIA